MEAARQFYAGDRTKGKPVDRLDVLCCNAGRGGSPVQRPAKDRVKWTMRNVNVSQTPAEVAVVLQTILRPSLERAVRSVFHQDFIGRIHLLIGVDVHQGDQSLLDRLAADCPSHVAMTIVDPGYSTSRRHGGVYPNYFGGSLRTVLSYLANSRLVAYLDDNDWFAADHLSQLKKAIRGNDWAWSGRWLVHPATLTPICRDEWDSVGERPGINADRYGGFVQPSGLMLDKEACHFVLPFWSLAAFPDGSGEDRLVFNELRSLQGAATDRFTAFCTLSEQALQSDHHQREFSRRSITWVADPVEIARIRDLEGTMGAQAAGGKWQEAIATAATLLEHHPHHPGANFILGQGNLMLGRRGEAIRFLSTAVHLDDLQPSWFESLAKAFLDSRRKREAREVMAALARRFRIAQPTTL
jgi:hypothetical protein